MRRFWAIRRIDRDYVEPTLYKSEAAARSAAASRRGYDVLALFSEAEARADQPSCREDGHCREFGCLNPDDCADPTPPKA